MALRISTKWKLKSPADLQAWGRRFSGVLKSGDVIALTGPLGAGKTTLVQGIAEGWGYKRGANSPTFALANEYKTPRGNVYHMDMYRLTDEELARFPLEEYWGQGLCVVEWADRVRRRWPAGSLDIVLSLKSPTERVLTIRQPSRPWQKRLAPLASPLSPDGGRGISKRYS